MPRGMLYATPPRVRSSRISTTIIFTAMRRARPYRGEDPEPGKDVTESLTPRPELEDGQDP